MDIDDDLFALSLFNTQKMTKKSIKMMNDLN